VTRIAAVNAVLPVHSYPQNEITEAFARMCATPAVSHQLLQRLHTSASVRTRHLALPLERYPTLENFGEANDAFLEVAVELGARAVLGALAEAGLDPDEVDVIVSTTVSGPTSNAFRSSGSAASAVLLESPASTTFCSGHRTPWAYSSASSSAH
jgi:alkylresorcinol/alkylpyrone synthase